MAKCAYCSAELGSQTGKCPACLRNLPLGEDDAYELPAQDTEIPDEWQRGATYTLELPVRCPHCRDVIRTLRAIRLKRSQAPFTSTLPRAGRVLVCPQCERVLSAELTAL